MPQRLDIFDAFYCGVPKCKNYRLADLFVFIFPLKTDVLIINCLCYYIATDVFINQYKSSILRAYY